MFIYQIILAVSSSIDSLGIGITYGIKNTSISKFGRIILFIISYLITFIALLFGNSIKGIFSEFSTKLLGFAILFFMGLFIFIQGLRDDNVSADFDNSNSIDYKEALFLGFALSLDSFDIGIGGGIIGISFSIFPFIVSVFQMFFLSFGNYLGKKLNNLSRLPNNVWSIISGVLLMFIGVLKLMF